MSGAPGAIAAIAAPRSPEISVRPSPPSARAVSRGLSISVPVPRRAGAQAISRMEPLSFRIERDGGGDRGPLLRAEMVDADRLAHARETLLHEAERNRTAEGLAHVARGDVAQRSARLAFAGDHMRAGRQRRLAAGDA